MFNVKTDYENAIVPRTVRFTEAIFEELGRISQEKNVSFNRLVLQCCQYALDNLEIKVKE